jgi:RimJ/RimL family protein N-acetyltransferase
MELRDLSENDFAVLLDLQRDPVSSRMAAFGTRDADPAELAARWKRALTNPSTIQKAIVRDGNVIGFVASFLREGKPEVTYWIARPYWGQGVATRALRELLRLVTVRPIHASAASDNAGSLRVLAKCGFTVCRSEKAFAEARGEEVVEVFLELR